MRREYKAYKKVGKIKISISELLELDLPRNVYASPGVINHIKKRHGRQLTKKMKDNIIDIIEKIIKNPEYVGLDYGRVSVGSLQLIKKVDNIILLLGLEIDSKEKYIYVATMYPITLSKMNARIYRGRLIKIEDTELKENILWYIFNELIFLRWEKAPHALTLVIRDAGYADLPKNKLC